LLQAQVASVDRGKYFSPGLKNVLHGLPTQVTGAFFNKVGGGVPKDIISIGFPQRFLEFLPYLEVLTFSGRLPTKVYGGFTLPGGSYLFLEVLSSIQSSNRFKPSHSKNLLVLSMVGANVRTRGPKQIREEKAEWRRLSGSGGGRGGLGGPHTS
jgi:hypothetical protein